MKKLYCIKTQICTVFEANRTKLYLGITGIFLLVFGYAVGQGKHVYDSFRVSQGVYYNYNTFQQLSGQKNLDGTNRTPRTGHPGVSTATDCLIKGNISPKGNKTFHTPTQKFYKVVKPEQCFTTEDEAIKAGFKKSSI